MPISDSDLQVLEEWLDGELPEAQTESLRRRLSMEPELALAADRLRGDRQLRSRLFTLLEPTERDMDPLVADLRREVRREELWASRVRGLKKITALAASIVLVFMAGWVSRERLQVGPADASKSIAQKPLSLQADNNVMMAGLTTPQDPGRLQFSNFPGGTDLSQIPVASRMDERRQVYQLILKDPSGKMFVLQTIDPRAVQQRLNNTSPERLQFPMLPPPQPQQRPQGILVGEERPSVR